MFDSVLWTGLECCLGVVSACLPTMRSMLLDFTPTRLFQRISRYFTASRSRTGSWDESKQVAHVGNHTIGGSSMSSNPYHEGKDIANSRPSASSAASDQENILFRNPETLKVSRSRGSGPDTCCIGHGEFDPYEVCPQCAAHAEQGVRHI